MNLEIKHILPYAQYGLMTNKGKVRGVELIRGEWCVKTDYNTIWHKLTHIKLLLKPLSGFESFVREVWRNESDKEVMKYTSVEYLLGFDMDFEDMTNTVTEYLPVGLYNLLLSEHYDVFELIPNKLAEVKG